MVAYVVNCENNFEAALATFCYYDYGVNASAAVEKIAKDQKGYHKCPSCVIFCWIAKIYQLIAVKKCWLLTYYDTSGVAYRPPYK